MFAYDYPILGLFWSMLFLFLWIAWVMLVFHVIIDVFRSGMSGISKALWSIFVIVIPWLGVLIYLVVNGHAMHQRDDSAARQTEADMQAYVRSAVGGGSTAEEIAKLSELHTKGVLTDAEFAQQKAKLLG